MKILIVVGPALGILNHTIALSHLLYQQGNHDIVWLTAPESREHLQEMGFSYPIYYSPTHSINFNKEDPHRKPHLHQTCNYHYLKNAVDYECKLIQEIDPDLIITKHHYSVPLSGHITGKPFATYYTDGAEYLIPGRNPQENHFRPILIENLKNVWSSYGNLRVYNKLTDYIKSPYLNIIRGIPLLSSLSQNEISSLTTTSVFGGLLFYDGSSGDLSWLDQINPYLPLIYVTFGTICRDINRFKIIIESVKNLEANIVISTVHIDTEDLQPCPENVILKQYVPNYEIMKKSDLVVHHGGHGTMLSAFLSGIPQLLSPDNATSSAQEIHAQTVERLKCGLYLSDDNFTSENLSHSIQQLICNKEYKQHAQSLQLNVHQQNVRYNNELLKKILHIS